MEGFKSGYALLIGIANYPKIRKLPKIVLDDAMDLSALLRSPDRCGYLGNHVRLLCDSQADADGIRTGFKWLRGVCGQGDTALVFISSHGGRVERGSQAGNYLLPYDCNPSRLKETAITGTELTDLMRKVQAQRLVALFDFCYSGGTGDTKGDTQLFPLAKGGWDKDTYQQLAQGTGRVIMASSRPDEESLILRGMDNSLFTHFLLEALRGKAFSRGDGLIRVFDIFHYIADNIRIHGRQHPIFKASDLEDNFPVALWSGGKESTTHYRPDPSAFATIDKRALREIMIRYFSSNELELLCADIQQDLADNGIELMASLEMVGGNNLPIQAHNLIRYFENRGYLPYLVQAIRQARPGIMCTL